MRSGGMINIPTWNCGSFMGILLGRHVLRYILMDQYEVLNMFVIFNQSMLAIILSALIAWIT